MTYYTKQGKTFTVSDSNAIEITETLPPANYVVKWNDKIGFFLEEIEEFTLPEKFYGDEVQTKTNRVITTFEQRSGNTGVLLVGEKGSGKTLLAKNISVCLKNSGLPTILINESYYGDEFNTFISGIDQPCVIMFDEFEKVYREEDGKSTQDKMLTLLDGVFTSKKLFLLTANDKDRISGFLENRPGRIYYSFEYKGLTDEFIICYCQDKLNDKEYIDDIIKFTMRVDSFNFDSLQAVVEELNRYGEDVATVLEYLNIDNDVRTRYYAVEVFHNNVKIPEQELENPLVHYSIDCDFYIRFNGDRRSIEINPEKDLISMNHKTKVYTFKTKDGYTVNLQKVSLRKFGCF